MPTVAMSLRSQTRFSHRWPVFLPDAEHFLFVAETFTITTDNSARGIFLGSLTGEAKKVTSLARSNPGYANGYLFYLDDKQSLRVTPFDVSKGTASGESQVVADQVGYQPSIFWGT